MAPRLDVLDGPMADPEDDRADAELYEAWRDGERHAGEQLFLRHVSAVVSLFESKVVDGVDDLIQATFTRMFETRDRIRQGHLFRSYLFGIARNVLREHLRSLARGRQVDPDVDSMAQCAPGPTTVVGERTDHQLLMEGLRLLCAEDQLLLVLSYWEGCDSSVIGRVLGIPPSTARNRLARGRKRLELAIAQLRGSPELLSGTVEELERWFEETRANFVERKPTASA